MPVGLAIRAVAAVYDRRHSLIPGKAGAHRAPLQCSIRFAEETIHSRVGGQSRI